MQLVICDLERFTYEMYNGRVKRELKKLQIEQQTIADQKQNRLNTMIDKILKHFDQHIDTSDKSKHQIANHRSFIKL